MLIRYAVGEMQPLFFGYSEFVFLCFSNLVAHKFKIEDKNSHTWYIFKFKWDFTRNSIHANVKKMIGHIFFSNFKIMAKGETVFQKKFFISYIQVLIFVIIPLLLTQKLTQKFAILHTIVLVFKSRIYPLTRRPLEILVWYLVVYTQPAFTCSKLTIETLEQGVKYVQS